MVHEGYGPSAALLHVFSYSWAQAKESYSMLGMLILWQKIKIQEDEPNYCI